MHKFILDMLAHHPETGQPIRILRSEAQITQSRRTLVWLQSGYNVSARWQRWNCLITEPTAWQGNATAVIVTDFQEAWIPILKELQESALIVCTCASSYSRVGLDTDNYLTYSDLYNMYPFLGEPIKNTDPIEKVVVSLAHILRFPYLAWTPSSAAAETIQAQLSAWQGHQQLLPPSAIAEEVVPACWLIQQWFQHTNARRNRELSLCLEKNIANPYIDKILLLNEREEELPCRNEKLVERVLGHRMTYKDVLDAIRTDIPTGAFVVFSNTDIWCDESLQVLWTIPMVEKHLFLALLRWEDGETPTLFGPRPDSQDTWIVAKDTIDFIPTEEEFGFPFGKPGCDNAIALAMLKKRCLVVNPAYSLKTYHVHASNIRNYNPRDVLYKPMYLYLDPTPIQLFAVEQYMKAWEKGRIAHKSFSRKIYGSPMHIKTLCNTLKDRDGEVLGATANIWTPTSIPVYELKNTFVSDTGLLSNFQAIFTGGYEAWKQGWQSSNISSISTTIHVPALISITAREECWKSLATWCLEVLPKVLHLRKQGGVEYEFLVPTLPEVPAFLYDCHWSNEHVGTVPHIPNTQYYCNKLLALAPLQQRISKEDIGLLRELLPPSLPSPPLIVVCLDDIFTEEWYDEWRTCHETALKGMRTMHIKPTDSNKIRRYAFQSAAWILGRRDALQWSWMAKPGTRILEWMLETDMTSDILHLAGAAECKYIVDVLPRETVELRQQAILDFGPLWRDHGFQELVASIPEKPVVYVPAGKALQGMFYHTGDSFREMVRLWEEKGYCTVLETEESPFIWWGDIGDVLLYDWDTPRWLHPSVNYGLALFGNCIPPQPEGQRQSVWGFWGRHPRMLEAVAEQGRLGWAERPLSSLFLGKVENGVQQARRCNIDWRTAVDLFSMPIDSTGAPYPFSQSEYLEKLRHTKFGLCLPGYGWKCNREIEYMALGVVPIVTPGVDMSGYLVQPQEGIHYFRANTPADVRRIVSETTEETWEAMSVACHTWWRQTASAEGLFRLTWSRIEQCRPLQGILLPPWNPQH